MLMKWKKNNSVDGAKHTCVFWILTQAGDESQHTADSHC